MARIPGVDELKKQKKLVEDIANRLEGVVEGARKQRDLINDAAAGYSDITRNLDRLIQKTQSKGYIINQKDVDRLGDMSNRIDKMTKKLFGATSAFEKLVTTAEKFSKIGIQQMWKGMTLGIDGLIEGIQRVYDLQERWTAALGKFNQKLGATTPNLGKLRQEAAKADGIIRGLGGAFGEGVQMVGDFTTAYGKMTGEFDAKFIAQLSRGFDLGAESAGRIVRTLDELGMTKDDQTKVFKDISTAAQAAGVSVNDLAKDFAGSKNFVAQFGKEGVKAFVNSAAYLKKFNVNLKETESFMSKFDTFDDAAQSVAKLNTVFGTNINALKLMNEQDPAKRMEMLRSSLLNRVGDFNKLSRVQRQILKDQTGLDETQLAAVLSAKNRDEAYAKMIERKEKADKKEASAQQLMQKQLRATATTMFNFGQAADRITTSIGNAIKPFLELIGLAKPGSGPFNSFSQIMGGITDRIVAFFNALAKNRDWNEFLSKTAGIVKNLAVAVGDFFNPDTIGKKIDYVIEKMKMLKMVAIGIVGVFAASKAILMVKTITDMAKGMSTIAAAIGTGRQAAAIGKGLQNSLNAAQGFVGGGGGGGMAKFGAAAGKLGSGAMMGGAAGFGVSQLIGGLGGVKGSTAGSVGAAGLGAIGSMFGGPLGGILGGIIGQTAGDIATHVYDTIKSSKLTKEQERLTMSTERLAGIKESNERSDEILNSRIAKAKAKEDAQNRIYLNTTKSINQIEQTAKRGKMKEVELNESQAQKVRERARELAQLDTVTGSTKKQFQELASGSGPLKITTENLNKLVGASNAFAASLDATRNTIDAQTKAQIEQVQNEAEIEMARLELQTIAIDEEAEARKAQIEELKRGNVAFADYNEAVMTGTDQFKEALQTTYEDIIELNAEKNLFGTSDKGEIDQLAKKKALAEIMKKRHDLLEGVGQKRAADLENSAAAKRMDLSSRIEMLKGSTAAKVRRLELGAIVERANAASVATAPKAGKVTQNINSGNGTTSKLSSNAKKKDELVIHNHIHLGTQKLRAAVVAERP